MPPLARNLLCAGLLLLPLAAAALDLTPHPSTRELEGMIIPLLQFQNGTKRINYQPPAQWQVSGGGQEVRFFPPDHPQSWLKFSLLPRPAAPTAETVEDLRKLAAQLLPKMATEPALLATVESPFTLQALASREFIFGYRQDRVPITHSISIVNFSPNERVIVSVVAQSADFDALHREAIASMFSWQEAN